MLLLWQQVNPENIQDMYSDIISKHLTQCNSHKKLYMYWILFILKRRIYVYGLHFPKIDLLFLWNKMPVPKLKLLLLTKISLNMLFVINAQDYVTNV